MEDQEDIKYPIDTLQKRNILRIEFYSPSIIPMTNFLKIIVKWITNSQSIIERELTRACNVVSSAYANKLLSIPLHISAGGRGDHARRGLVYNISRSCLECFLSSA